MIVNTPDGPVNFPDSMSSDDIQGVLRQKYGFQGGAPAPPSPSSSASPAPTDPLLAQQPNEGWGGYLLRHLHAASRAIDDLTTFGYGDKGQGALDQAIGVGPTTAQLRGDTNTAYATNPAAVNAALGAATYAMGPGEIGIASKLGGGVLGSGAELGTVGLLTGAGKSDAKTWGGLGADALTGGAIGGVTGLGLGAAGKYVLNPIVNAVANKVGSVTGALSAPADITATAKTAKDATYDALKPVPADVTDAAATARSAVEAHDPGGSLQANAPRTMAVLNRIDKSLKAGADQDLTGQDAMDYLVNQRTSMAPDDYRDAMNDLVTNGKITVPGSSKPTTASDLRTWLDELRDVQGPTAGAENELAPIVEQHLNAAVDDAGARGLFDQADAAYKVYKNAQFLQKGREGLKYFGQSPGGDAASIAQKYYPSGAADLEAGRPTPAAAAYQRLSDITMAGGGMPSGYSLAHMIYPLTEAAGSGLGAMVGGPAGAIAGDVLGGVAGAGMKTGLSNAVTAAQRRATQSALTAAYPDLTGQGVKFPAMNLSPALRAIIFGSAAPYLK